MTSFVSVAIDGPVGAGKSSIARNAAKKLGFIYVDTGALYRAVGLYCHRKGIDMSDGAAVASVLSEIDPEIRLIDGTQHIYLNKEDVSEEIRLPEISMAASAVSAVPEVRASLLDLQRNMAKTNNVIMDGRDIGTNVLTDAEVKIFMTASAEERADRRYKELIEKGQDVTYDQILEDIKQRDHNDMTRALNPLKKADDAIELDTTGMSIEEVTDYIMNEVIK